MSHQGILAEKLVYDYVSDPVRQLGGQLHVLDLTVANGATRRGNTSVLCLYYVLATLWKILACEAKVSLLCYADTSYHYIRIPRCCR